MRSSLLIKCVVRLVLTVTVMVAAVMALTDSAPASQAWANDVDLALDAEGTNSWNISNIAPGDSGSETVKLSNDSGVDGFVIIWISDLEPSQGDNPEPEPDTEGDGELDDHMLFSLSCSRLSSNITAATIHEFPQDPSGSSFTITPLKAGETVTLDWHWELPSDTGNEAQGDSLSFNINYGLEELTPSRRPSGGAAYIPPRPPPTTEIAGPVCEWKIIQLTVSPYEVNVGEPVTVGVLITNPCDEAQECEVILKVNGVVEGRKVVVVMAGETKRVTFTISKHAVGTYLIEVNGLGAGTFVVLSLIHI